VSKYKVLKDILVWFIFFLYIYTLKMKKLKLTLTLFLLVFASQVLLSAPPPPPAGGPGCWPPPCVPIDGGITFLIAAGAAYGAKKLVDARKKNKSII
jgi:hypothetical protein